MSYGIFLEHQLATEETFDVSLLGYRFDTHHEAVDYLDEHVYGSIEVDGLGQHYLPIDEDDMPFGYIHLVYFVDEIEDYDLKNYSIS